MTNKKTRMNGHLENAATMLLPKRRRNEKVMKGEGSRIERETTIVFNEEEETASIWTASDTVYRRLLKRLGRAYLTQDGERHAVFTFPKEFLGLPRLKTKKVLDPDRRAKLVAQAAEARKTLGPASNNGQH